MGKCTGNLIGLNRRCQAAQPLYQRWAGMLCDVDIDAVHVVYFERIDTGPVGAFVHQGRITAVSRVFSQNDELWIGGNDRFLCDLGITTVAGLAMEDINAMRVM